MSTMPQPPRPGAETRSGSERPQDPFPHGEAEERADLAEDRRRQRDLDEAELGGEG